MRLLAEDAAVAQGLADGASRAVELERKPKAATADGDKMRAAHATEAGEGEGAEFGRASGEVFVDKDAEGGAGDGAGERVAAEGAAVIAGLEDAEDLA